MGLVSLLDQKLASWAGLGSPWAAHGLGGQPKFFSRSKRNAFFLELVPTPTNLHIAHRLVKE